MIEIKEEVTDNYKFVLKSESGRPLFNSIAFANRRTTQKVVRSLKARQRHTFERKTNHNGKFLFSLKGKAGEVIGNSQLYNSEAGMENGIKNFINRIKSLSEQNQL